MKIKSMLLGALALSCVCAFGEETRELGVKDGSPGAAARKLQTCGFLLNKDFKKNVKYYLCLFSASWCGPCRREMPRIAKTYAETLKDDPNIELIHFSRDREEDKALAWAKEHDVKFPVVKYNGGNPLDLHTRGIPHLFIVNANGKLLEEGHPMKLFTDEKLRELKATVGDSGDKGKSASDAAKPTDVKLPYEVVDGAVVLGEGTDRSRRRGSSKRKSAVLKITGSSGNLVIPEVIDGIPVRSIGLGAFADRKGLVSVTIPSTVTSIGESAFRGCRGLSSVTIPSSVTSIGRLAFSSCSGLAVVTIRGERPDAPKNIFERCGKLKSIHVPANAKSWAGMKDWHGIPLVFDAEAAESRQEQQRYMNVNNGLTEIKGAKATVDGYTWSYSVKNGEATIENRVDNVYCCAVSPKLTGHVVIPSELGGAKVTRIGVRAFYYCDGLKSLTIPEGVKIIDHNVFMYCRGLASVKIPESVTSIGGGAFYQCWSLTSVTIPVGVTNICDGAFMYCNRMRRFEVDQSNKKYKSVNGLLLSKDGAKLIAGVNGEVVIPPGVKDISSFAFLESRNLTAVTIPEGVTSIGRWAFSSSGLTEVTIPSSVMTIGEGAFRDCRGLKRIEVAHANKKFQSVNGLLLSNDGKRLIAGVNGVCGEVNIPSCVTSIEKLAFDSCRGLVKLSIPASVDHIEEESFRECSVLRQFVVDDSNESYKSKNGLLLSKDGKRLIAGVNGINGEVIIPPSVNSIAPHAFHGCRALTKVTIPPTVVSFGSDAFFACLSLKRVIVGKGDVERVKKSIGGGRFSPDMAKVIFTEDDFLVTPATSQPREFHEANATASNMVHADVNVVANKLQDCNFLLNKGFKKNAKYYLCLFSASWCGPCRREMPRIAKTYAETLKDDPNIELIHFSRDQNNEKALAWAKEHDVKFPVVKPNGGNPLDLHSRGIPHLFIVKADGTLVEEGHPMKLFTDEKLRGLTTTNEDGRIKGKSTSGDTKADGFWTVAQYNGTSSISSLAEAQKVVNQSPKVAERTYQTLSFGNNLGDRGDFPHVEFPGTSGSADLNYFAITATGSIYVPHAGDWTFACRSDDGFHFIISGNGLNDFFMHDRILPFGSKPLVHMVNFPCAGVYTVTCLYFENWGGAGLEFSVARGSHPSFDSSKFKLVGDPESGIVMAEAEQQVDVVKLPYEVVDGVVVLGAQSRLTLFRRFLRRPGVGDNRKYAAAKFTQGALVIPKAIDDLPVRSIGHGAFSNCKGMTSVTIPASVTNIVDTAFSGCNEIMSFSVDASNPSYSSRNGLLCSKDGTALIAGVNGEVTIPPCVKSIGKEAFKDHNGLMSVTIPESVTNIADMAFSSCNGLKSVRIPANVESMGKAVFSYCSALKEINVDAENKTFTSIDGVLYTKDSSELVACPNALTEVTISKGVTGIGPYAFEGCNNMTSVTMPEGVTRIECAAFKECGGLASVAIPSSVERIEKEAFLNCRSLTSVTIPDGVTCIDEYAFRGCGGLTAITIQSSVKDIKRAAFYGCSGLTSLTIQEGVEVIDWDAFQGCTSLTSVTIPSSVTNIWACAFCKCSQLKSATILSKMLDIGYGAFKECGELTAVTMRGECPTSQNDIFKGCGKLKAINVPATAKSWDGMQTWHGIPIVVDGTTEPRTAAVEIEDLDIAVVKERAENGDAAAMCELGSRYRRGVGVGIDDNESAKWTMRAASNGHERAIGICYALGYGVAKDAKEEAKWYKRAVDKGDRCAMNNLGLCYEKGAGVEKDEKEAAKWMRMAADKGLCIAMDNFSRYYYYGIGVDKDYKESLKWMQMVAEKGDAVGMLGLGEFYRKGEVVDKDEKESVKWYRRAAEKGHVMAMNNLGVCYEKGAGVEKDEKEAVKWVRMAADKGLGVAMRNLGRYYDNGIGVDKDYKESLKWLRMAAEKGDVSSMFALGYRYENGNGVEKDEKEAEKWYRMAADKGDARAIEHFKGADRQRTLQRNQPLLQTLGARRRARAEAEKRERERLEAERKREAERQARLEEEKRRLEAEREEQRRQLQLIQEELRKAREEQRQRAEQSATTNGKE